MRTVARSSVLINHKMKALDFIVNEHFALYIHKRILISTMSEMLPTRMYSSAQSHELSTTIDALNYPDSSRHQ